MLCKIIAVANVEKGEVRVVGEFEEQMAEWRELAGRGQVATMGATDEIVGALAAPAQFGGGARKIPQSNAGGKYPQRFEGRQSFRHASFEAELHMKVKNYRYGTEPHGPTI